MILGKRTILCCLLVLALLNIVFRYPIGVSHELGADTTFVHSLTASIAQEGRAAWILHPFSYFGLYALSYPSAVPFIFASGSDTSGAPMELITLLFGWLIAVVGCWSAFIFARTIRRDDLFALLVALLFPLAPFFIKDTFWIASTRGFVVGLLPAFLALLVRSMRKHVYRDAAIAFVLFILLAAIHRMGVLSLFFLIAYVFAIPFHKLTQRLRFALVRYDVQARYGIAGLAVVVFLGIFSFQFLYPGALGANIIDQYRTSALLEGDSLPILVANMGVSLSGKVGPMFVLTPIGLLAYVWRRPKEATDKFVLTAAFLFLPLLSLRDYIAEFLIPVFIFLSVFGFTSLRFNRRKVVAFALIIVVSGSAVFSWEMKDYWSEHYGTDAPTSDVSYSAALYLRYETSGTIVSNDGLIAGQLAAFSGRPILPLGGASLHWTGPQELTWRFIGPNDIRVQLLPITTISFNTDEIYVALGLRNVESDWETMLYYVEPSAANQQFLTYDVHYIAVKTMTPDTFLSYAHDRPSVYLATVLPSSSYIVYENGAITIWFRG